MTAPLVHSVIAAGLSDPYRLRNWMTEPAALERYGVDPSSLDLDALADFAGLSEKVRHNQCRQHLELSFRLMRLTGVEVQLFRDYAPRSRARRRQGLISVPDRLDGLAQFVEEWAAGGGPVRTLLRDVLGHEYVIAVLRRSEVAPPAPTGPARVPVHHGRIVVRRSTCDPSQVASVLRAREPDLAAIERGVRTFVYQKAPGSDVRILEVEDGVAELLLAVDGRSSVEDLAGRLFGGALVDPLRSTLEQLADLGVLAWSHDGGVPCG
ncbi:MAG: RiPP maturation protein ApyI [Acidimicrobiales bacterium]